MKRLLTLAALWTLLMAAPASASPIYYEVANLGGDRWQYHYTVGNDTGDDIDWFTIFFDPELYAFDLDGDEVDGATYAGAAGWDMFVAPPETEILDPPADAQPGLFDGCLGGDLCPVSNGALEPGSLVSGFSMIFTWLPTDGSEPGSQPFTLYGDWLLPELGDNLFTQRLGGEPVGVPEPGSLGLLGASVVLFGFGRRVLARG